MDGFDCLFSFPTLMTHTYTEVTKHPQVRNNKYSVVFIKWGMDVLFSRGLVELIA